MAEIIGEIDAPIEVIAEIVATGRPGEPGYTPQRGIDYWTPEDVEEITEEAAERAALSINEDDVELGDLLSVERLGAYLYTATFDAIPPRDDDDDSFTGGCSSYVRDGKLYRHLDWEYDNTAEFHVICKDFEGMAFIHGMNDGEIEKAKCLQLPYHLVDGRNADGIMVSTHVLYNDWEYEGTGDKSVPLFTIPHYVLSHLHSMDDIEDVLAESLANIAVHRTLAEAEYLEQFIVTDGITTYAILPPMASTGDYQLVDISANPKLTNFRWVNSETVLRAWLQKRPNGVERWNMMPCPLTDLRYTKAYESPVWLSEFIGIADTDKDSTDEQLEAIYEYAHAAYLTRERNGELWQTMHSVVYSANGMEHLWVQENWSKDYVAQGGGGGTEDFDILINRPYYNGDVMTHDTRIPQVKTEAWDAKYDKPNAGIPKSDLAEAVQSSLDKADSALQEHQSLAAYRTSSAQDAIDATKYSATNPPPYPVTSVNGQTGAVTVRVPQKVVLDG